METILSSIRKILISVIVAGFAYGITLGICEAIKEYYRHSGGLVTAKEMLDLSLAPVFIGGAVLFSCLHLSFKKEK